VTQPDKKAEMTFAQTGAQGAPQQFRGSFLTWGAAAASVFFFMWMGLGWDFVRSRDTYFGRKTDYYSSQVHGFLSGHLYMDKEAYAGWDSPDPAVRAKAPFLLDSSYYKGHYYLYFGVTPAALFLLPYAWLTGSDLHPRCLVAVGAALGFLFSAGILRMAERDHFGRLSGRFRVAAIGTLAFASAAPLLLTWAKFYEVAIATGYAFTMAGAFWTYRAVSGRGRTWLQLALASLSFGLAVGCRPNLVLNLPVLAAVAVLAAWQNRKRTSFFREFLGPGAAAAAPAACVGTLLALYNYERFGSPFEFGVTYSMNSFMQGGKPLFSTAYLWPNIHWYYLTFPALSPFFPFVFPECASFGPEIYRGGEAIHGQFTVFLLCTFVAVSAVLVRNRLRSSGLAAFLGLLGWMFLAVFLAISGIGFRGDRYMVDCQGPLALGVVLLAAAIASALGKGRGPGLWRAGFVILAAVAATFNIFAGLQEFNAFKNLRTSTYQTLETLGNYPASWLERCGFFRAGPIELKVVFPKDVKGASIEPLLVAGTPDLTDSLYVIESPSGEQIELLADHSGYGGPSSDPIRIVPGRTYSLKVDMGALYPPRGPPFTTGFKVSQGRHLKTRILVEMDGRVVLERRMNSYDAPPWSLQFGKNTATMNPYKTEFSGQIVSATRLPSAEVAEKENDGLWRIRCAFPEQRLQASFPLLSAGLEGSGTLIFISRLPDNQVQFGLDEWGYGGGLSPAVKPAIRSTHVVEILIGPLAARERWPAEWSLPPLQLGRAGHELVVWLDGRPVWTTELRHAVDPLDSLFEVGGNSQGFTSALDEFPGSIHSDPFTREEAREFLSRNIGAGP
jgi:hypothetical protein